MNQNSSNTIDQKELLGKELAEQLEQEKKDEETNRQIAEAEKKQKEEADKNKKKNVLINTLGEKVDSKDYFYSTKGKDTMPPYFEEVCGRPVDREDMLAVFNKIFNPKHGILFYKTRDKEVYIIIVPIKHSSIVGAEHNSIDGEFQKHAISFITEGSVNLDTLRNKLERVAKTIHIVVD